jgi:hypothetical protein
LVPYKISPPRPIWVRPDDIVFKIVGDHDLHANDILAGDWDLQREPD